MAALNKCEFIGNLGRDVEMRITLSGVSVATFSIAVTEKYNDRSGNRQETTEWISCKAWDKLAELAGKYLKKGSSVYVSGKMVTSDWIDKKDSGKRYKTEVVLKEMQFLGGKPENGQQSQPQQSQSQYPEPSPQSYQPPVDDEDSLSF